MASSRIPDDLRYSKDHEWARVDGDQATVGITDFAQDALGDVVFVDLPEVGAALKQFEKFGEVESVKSVSDLFSPLGGEVTARNDAVSERPELINRDPYGEGWLLRLRVTNAAELDGLLDAAAYEQHTQGG